jgi:hypothetical protein
MATDPVPDVTVDEVTAVTAVTGLVGRVAPWR